MGAVEAALAVELRKQMLVFGERERANARDEEATFMRLALACTREAADTMVATAAPAFVWSFGLVGIVEAVVDKYRKQAAAERLEWWQYAMSGAVNSDVRVAIALRSSEALALAVHLFGAWKRALSGVSSALLALPPVSAVLAAVGSLVAFAHTNAKYVQWAAGVMEPFAVRCVLNVLLKGRSIKPDASTLRATKAAPQSGAALELGAVVKKSIAAAAKNVLVPLFPVSVQATLQQTLRAAMDAAASDDAFEATMLYRLTVMHVQSTGGPRSVRRKLEDPYAAMLNDAGRTARVTSMLGEGFVRSVLLMPVETMLAKVLGAAMVDRALKLAGLGGWVGKAQLVLKLAMLSTLIAYDAKGASFWRGASAVRRAAERGDERAEYVMGRIFLDGHGEEQSDDEAARWFRRAADKGYALARLGLAALLDAGRCAPRGEGKTAAQEAAEYRSSAEAESASSVVQFAAGLYLDAALGAEEGGVGGEKNLSPTAATRRWMLEAVGAAAEGVVWHYELIHDKQGWYGESRAAAAGNRTAARARRGTLWQQFVMSAQCDRIVAAHVGRELRAQSAVVVAVREAFVGGGARDLLVSACLYGMRTCLSETYELAALAPIAPCPVRDFPKELAVLFAPGAAPRFLGVELVEADDADDAENAENADGAGAARVCRLPTQFVIAEAAEAAAGAEAAGAGEATRAAGAARPAEAALLEKVSVRERVLARTDRRKHFAVAAAAEAADVVAYATVRAWGEREITESATCARMNAVARAVVRDMVRMFRFEARRWCEGDAAMASLIEAVDGQVQGLLLWILAEFADVDADGATPHQRSRVWAVFCVSPFLGALVDECTSSLKAKAEIGEALANRALRAAAGVSVEWRAALRFDAACEVIGVCMLAALRRAPYHKLHLVLPFLRHGAPSLACKRDVHV
jgi:TPR repeat protein